jgi:hypothetical protein
MQRFQRLNACGVVAADRKGANIIRREPSCILLHCYGASKNVDPSGMCRDMGAGLHAYKMFDSDDDPNMVSIFDSGDDVRPSTVSEQREFFETWFKKVCEESNTG